MQPFAQSAVRRNADRLAPGRLGDQVRVLVPVRLPEAKPVHLAAGGAVTVEVGQRPFGEAVLPGVDPTGFGVLEQLDDPFGRVPVGLILAEDSVEMRIAVDGVAAEDQARDLVRAKLDGRQ